MIGESSGGGRRRAAEGTGWKGAWECGAGAPGGPEWRERRMRERSFLDSESPKSAPCAKLNWVLNLGAARRRGF